MLISKLRFNMKINKTLNGEFSLMNLKNESKNALGPCEIICDLLNE